MPAGPGEATGDAVLTFPQPTCFGGMCTIEPIANFGHPPMTLVELVPHLRERAARTSRLDDVQVSKTELFMLLDALEGKP